MPTPQTPSAAAAAAPQPEAGPAADAALTALARRFQAGEVAAFEELYRLTRQDAARTLHHLVGRRADLEDLLQDCYLRLFDAVRGFRGEAQFRTFLYRVCANVALMHLRWQRRRPEEPVAEPPERASSADPEAEAARREAGRLVEQALEALSPKKRIVFVYHELCGMGPEEISRAVGTSPNTVRSRLHHARLEFAEATRALLAARRGGGHG